MATRPGLIALLLAASGCAQYRSYPLLSLEPPGKTAPLELSGVALLDDGHVVAVAEGVADVLYAPDPDTALRPGGLLDLLPLRDGRDSCAEDDNASARCDVRHFRAEVRLQAQPIDWLEREKGVRAPFDVEDLSAFGPNRVIGVTKYSSVGRRTGFRRDLMARSRRQTERLFVLERRGQTWVEQDLPEITRLRDSLSDWGRANCNDDLLVEGLAYDREGGDVYVGLSRCSGPALRVLRYPLVDAKMGLAATLSVLADGSSGAPLGPAEGLTGLSTQSGHIYAVSAWDSYGYDTEPAFGGRLWRVDGDRLTPLDLADIFHDRPSALAVLPSSNPESDAVEALVLFDNDAEAGSAWHPNATVLTTPTAAPHSGAWARLISVERMPDALPLGLNGFDLRWFARDHRLAQLAVSLAKNSEGEPGAWTRALGGRWQVEIGGSLGMWARTFLPRSAIGRNRQAVALTDYSGVPGLNFTRYRVRITVVPRDRERENPSVAELMEQARPAYTVRVPIGVTTPGAGVVLQGFQIDTAARAEEGICLAGLDLGASLLDSTTIQVQSTIIGGICNDFDNRGPTLRHGRTTSPEGGVSVVLDLAVIEGAAATETSTAMWDRALPAPKVAPEADRADAALKATTDRTARANLHCGRAEAAAFTALPRQEDAPPPDWQVLGSATSAGAGGAAGSLRGFAFALDPVGFDPGLARPHLTEAEALARNNYVYRYLARLFVTPNGTFVEGGLSHGIHRSGLMRDNARPSALYTRLDATTFATLPAAATPWDLVTPAGQDDPNLLPEDGFVRWAAPFPLTTEPACSPGFWAVQLALAGDDATGARPGLGAPVLEWKPVLELRTGVESELTLPDGGGSDLFTLAGRLGLEAQRKSLRLRLSLADSVVWHPIGITLTDGPRFGEAWAGWSVPLSSALGLEFSGGIQPLEWDDGAVLGDDDLRLEGNFPLAGRVRVRALPWELDAITGMAVQHDRFGSDWSSAFHALRLGAGRENPSAAWKVGAVFLLVNTWESDVYALERSPLLTTGLTASAAVGRVRASADGYLQPTVGAPAPMASGQLGWALGDDARVVLSGRFDWLGGGETPTFLRPLADTHQRFGWLGLFDDTGLRSGAGALDAALTAKATIAPPLRLDAAVHHLWDGAGEPLGGELDADLKWYFSPLAAVHVRGGAFVPWSNDETVRIQSAVTIDASL